MNTIKVGDKVNTFAGSVAVVLAITGDKATIEVICLNDHPVFAGVPLRTLTPVQ